MILWLLDIVVFIKSCTLNFPRRVATITNGLDKNIPTYIVKSILNKYKSFCKKV